MDSTYKGPATIRVYSSTSAAARSGGSSPARKLFQANHIYRSQARFKGPNWLVGGDTDADSNICIGLRIGLFAEGEGTVVRGNYLHLRMPNEPSGSMRHDSAIQNSSSSHTCPGLAS